MFSSLIGNEVVKAQLEKMLQEECLPHTLLFSGPEGVGKRLFAEKLGLALLCSTRLPDRHPDLHHYYPDGKSGLHSIASIRDLLHEIHLPPFEAKKKVFLIHEAEQMLPTSSNALLKTFEEPPLDTWLILLTSKETSLLPTIVSRCRRVRFQPIATRDLVVYLEKDGKSREEAEHLASFAQGSLAKALALGTSTENSKREILLKVLKNKIYEGVAEWQESLDLLGDNEELAQEKQEVEGLLMDISYWYRDLYLASIQADSRYFYHRDHLEILQSLASSHGSVPLHTLEAIMVKAHESLVHHVRLRHVLEGCFLKLAASFVSS